MLMPEARALRGESTARGFRSPKHPKLPPLPCPSRGGGERRAGDRGQGAHPSYTPYDSPLPDNPGNPHGEKPIYEKRKGEERLPYGTFYERSNLGNASYVDGIQ